MIKILFLFITFLQYAPPAEWVPVLREHFRQIEAEMDGTLGVYVKHLGDGHSLSYNAEKDWYLSSVVKVPVAIALLQKVEEGELTMDHRLILQETDFVDGAGDLIRQPPGTTYTLEDLIEKMIRNSDSSATDMLVRLLGENELNEQVQQNMVEGFHPITTLLQVRYEAFSQIHENARELTNIDFIELRKVPDLHGRMNLLVEKMGVDRSEINAPSIFEAFERYYNTGLNSATLEATGLLLEKLYNRQLLSDQNTRYLLNNMQNITTGERRIKAELPPGTTFAQKTGTQIRSACNVGIIFSDKGGTVIVAACVEGNDLVSTSEQALQKVGKALSEAFDF